MSVNKHKPHVLLLPEDDANRQIARGFQGALSAIDQQMRIEPVAGGWLKVLECFKSVHALDMDRLPHRNLILLIDFDDQPDRLVEAKDYIPSHLNDRVFILGALTEPEDLKQAIGSFENIGKALAKDCREGTNTTWGHEMLRHNADEVVRLRKWARPILFGAIY